MVRIDGEVHTGTRAAHRLRRTRGLALPAAADRATGTPRFASPAVLGIGGGRDARARAILRTTGASALSARTGDAGRTRAATSPAVERVREQVDATRSALGSGGSALPCARPVRAHLPGRATHAATTTVGGGRPGVDAATVAERLLIRTDARAADATLASRTCVPACTAVVRARRDVDTRLPAGNEASRARGAARAEIAERRASLTATGARSAVARIRREVRAAIRTGVRARGASATTRDTLLEGFARCAACTAVVHITREVDARRTALGEPGRTARGARAEIAERRRARAFDSASTTVAWIGLQRSAPSVARALAHTWAERGSRRRSRARVQPRKLERDGAAACREHQRERKDAGPERDHPTKGVARVSSAGRDPPRAWRVVARLV